MVSQVNGEFEAREPGMVKYLKKAKAELNKCPRYSKIKIPQKDNKKEDTLSKLSCLDKARDGCLRPVFSKLDG